MLCEFEHETIGSVLTANTRHEKGYGDDEVDLKVVDIGERLRQLSMLNLIFTADKGTTQCL